MKLSIGKVGPDRKFTITLSLATEEERGTVELDPAFADARLSRPERAERLLAVVEEECPAIVRSFKRGYRDASELTLEIEEPRLYDVPWELACSKLSGRERFRGCLRLTQASRSREPILPPFDVLWATADPVAGYDSPRPPKELKHYRCTISQGATPEYLKAVASARQFHVVHIAGLTAMKRRGRGMLTLGGASGAVSPARLQSLLRSPPRLLVLEGVGGSMSALIDFAHHYSNRTGVAVLAVQPQSARSSRELSSAVYLGIAHDRSLEDIVAELQASDEFPEPPVLVSPPGAEEALRLELPELIVGSWYRDLAEQSGQRLDRLQMLKRAFTLDTLGASESFARQLERHEQRLKEADKLLRKKSKELEFSYDREAKGIRPMAEAVRAASRISEVIDGVRAVTERVVNTSFVDDGRFVEPTRDLVCRKKYLFRVQIGALSPESNNRSPRALPEQDLERLMTAKGLELRAVVQSRQFKVLEPEKGLLLPPRPWESVPLTFEVVAPAEPGAAELLFLLFYKRNLLQAIRVWAQVSESGSKARPRGNHAETEFALESLGEDIETLPDRDVQLFAGGGPDRTHTLSIRGSAAKQHFELSDGKLRTALGTSRARLLEIAQDLYDHRKIHQRRRGRRSTASEFLDDLRRLAYTGAELFEALVPGSELREQLTRSVSGHHTLQIAHSKSLDQIFPWAVVYDHPLLVTEPRICPDAAEVLDRRNASVADLEQLECMSNGCRYRGDTETICPSGFWGFRHVLELPLSLAPEGDGGLEREIVAGNEARLCMGAYRDLEHLLDHERELKRILRLRIVGPQYRKKDFVGALGQKHFHVLYLYCHGDKTPTVSATALRLGSKDRPDYLYAIEMEPLIKLQDTKPMVFINGCHTADITPDDLVTFNQKLSAGGAAAVIGTEIKVHESLAAPAAEKLLGLLVTGTPLGQALRNFRLGLLLERNPLGLTYTSYGYSGLTLAIGGGFHSHSEAKEES